MLSIESKQYKKDGYFIAKNLVPRILLEETYREMDIILVQQLNRFGYSEKPTHTHEGVHAHMRELYKIDQHLYLQAIKLWAKLASIFKLFMHENVARMAKQLGIDLPVFQTNPVIHVMANDLKITDGYHGVGIHQDWPSLQSGLDTVTTWIPFMDVDKNNFPLELIPSSHLNGLYPGTPSEHIFEIDPTCYQEKDFIPIEIMMGDVLFMSNFIIHRSSLQGDTRLRAAISMRYENACESTFIERAYPSAQKRIIQRELISPGFPEKHHLDKIYT